METTCKGCGLRFVSVNSRTGRPFKHCDVCKTSLRVRRADRKAAGKCRDCARGAGGKTRCPVCIRRIKASLRRRGRCESCGGANTAPGVICARCALKGIARRSLGDKTRWTEIQQLIETQGFRCAVTGELIAVSETASLDHIVPKNRGGGHESGNLRWVHIVVNRMKNDMTDAELLRWAELLVASRSKLDAQAVTTPPARAWPGGMVARLSS